MIDTTQILLFVVITVSTILLSAVGVQVFLILKEIRESIRKMNRVLDNVGEVSEAITRPIASLSDTITGISGVTGILGWLSNRRKKRGEEVKEKNG